MAGPRPRTVDAATIRPTHLVARPRDEVTLCGLLSHRDGQRAYPQMWVAHVETHRRGHAEAGRPFVVCSACEAARR